MGHEKLPLAYLAQRHVVHLEQFEKSTPLEYLQARYRHGYDEEAPTTVSVEAASTTSKKEEDKLRILGQKFGKCGKQVESLVNRVEDDEHGCLYEVKWMGLDTSENTYVTKERLKQLGVEHKALQLDDRLWAAWADTRPRSLSTSEVVKHFRAFGLTEHMTCNLQISKLSSGQRCKLMLGASFWTRPHLLCLDEPTNYLDVETVKLLERALRSFRGGFAVVTHSEKFVENICGEVWAVADGHVVVKKKTKGNTSD